jgi:hypothetical protein
MKTGFTNSYVKKNGVKYYRYHGFLLPCYFSRKYFDFLEYYTSETPACVWNPLLATWVSPTSHKDPDSKWIEPLKAYDGNYQTFAYQYIPANSWSSFLTLYHDPLWANKVIVAESGFPADVHTVDIDAYFNGVWNDIYEGWFQWGEDIVADFFWQHVTTACRVRFFNDNLETDRREKLWEVHFWGIYPLC